MNFAPLYLLNRFFFRISDFFHHWYIDGSRVYAHRVISALSDMDRVFAVRITLHLFGKPLYGDYSVIGRVMGIVLRFFRVLVGLVFYAAIILVALIFYMAWLIIPFVPLFLAYRAFAIP